ncbi:MAG: hypothetical protein ACFFCV_12980 [Promethearchaeota archaeon]
MNVRKVGTIISGLLFFSSLIFLFSFNSALNKDFSNVSNLTEDNEFEDFELRLSDSPLLDFSGVGQAQNISKSGNGYFENNNLNITNNDKASITVPEYWIANDIKSNITNLYDYDTYWINSTFDSGYNSKLWSNDTNNEGYVTFGWYDALIGRNDSIYMRFEESGSSWANKYSNWVHTLPIPREHIPFEDWEITYNYRVLCNNLEWLAGGSAYHSIFLDVDGSSREFSQLKLDDLVNNTWYSANVPLFQPETYGWALPGTISLKFEINYKNSDINPTGWFEMHYDNITLKLSTIPKPSQINLTVNDETNGIVTEINDLIEFGEGTVNLKDVWDGDDGGKLHYFSYAHNSSGNVILSSNFYLHASSSRKTTTHLGVEGSEFTVSNNTNVKWTMYFTITQPGSYSNGYYFNISKPLNWIITEVIDPYLNNKVNDTIGAGYGNTTLIVPNDIITNGLWKFVAESPNYVKGVDIYKNSSIDWIQNSTFQINDKLKINASIDIDQIPDITGTKGFLQIFYPNGTLFYSENASVGSDAIFESSEIILGAKNASAGNYTVYVKWCNHDVNMSQVGLYVSNFVVIHQTELTAINPYFELYQGDPLLIRVKFIDFNLNTSIPFATITYESSFSSSGDMIYQGLGIYFAEIDTNSLGLGDYYFSFNASKDFYQSQIKYNLIHLKIIPEPLVLELPKTAVSAIGNDYVICQINVTGSFSGSLIWPANVSTDWQNPYNVINHNNGTYSLNFSTSNIPGEGIIETFSVSIFANKTNYGTTTGFITIIVYPINTIVSVNRTIVDVYLNEIVDIQVNYSVEGSGSLITGANCSVDWPGLYNVSPDGDSYIISLNTATFSTDTYLATIKMEKAGYETAYKTITVIVSEQEINLTVYINSQEIMENSLIELYFKEDINILVRAFAIEEEKFLSGGLATFVSDNYEENLTEVSPSYYNATIRIDGNYFDPGINTIYILYQQQNYTTNLFSFQFLVYAQEINLTVHLNSQEIMEHSLIELYFKEDINILLRAFAIEEEKFLSGGLATFVSDKYDENLTEVSPTYFNTTIRIESDKFNPGINTIYLLYQQQNYSSGVFSFQFLIHEQDINLSVYINTQKIMENSLIEVNFNEEITLSCRAYAEIEEIYLDGGKFTFVSGTYKKNIPISANFWFNTSITIESSNFSLGINYIYVEFAQVNYTSEIFAFQIIVNQIEINVKTIGFEDPFETLQGKTILIQLNLTELESKIYIDNASIYYQCDFGNGYFDYVGNGIYELELKIPEGSKGNHKITLIISKEESIYQTREFSFIIAITSIPQPNYVFLYIIIGLILGLSILGILSLRAYVIVPAKRRKKAELLAKTQRFKDAMNVQGLVLSQRESGLALFTKSYYALESAKKDLLSGFIYAITTISQEFMQKEAVEELKLDKEKIEVIEKIIELDFQYFNFLICDYKSFRAVFILKEEASERLKKHAMNILINLDTPLAPLLDKWDGSLDKFEEIIPPTINKYCQLYYKEHFVLNKPKYINKVVAENDLNPMESRVLNVIKSMTQRVPEFYLIDVVEMVGEKNKDLVIVGIESIIEKNLIIPAPEKNQIPF